MKWKDPTEFRNRFEAWKNGEQVYEAGLPKYKDGYESFLATLPDNQRKPGAYNTRRYWELNGKPKNFAEAVGKGMYNIQEDDGVLGWRANSVSYNENNDTYEFMKPNYHPTRWMEQVYGYDQSPEFQKEWKVQYNGPMLSDRYIRREKPGFKIKGGQLPRFAMGTEGNLNMGRRKQITPREAAEVAQSTIHEQPVSNTDPIGEFVVKSVGATKAAGIFGEILTAARLNRMAETYRNLRKYDSDIQPYTGKSLRREHIQEADKIARDGFLYSRPENPLYWILDPIIQGYSKLQSHPIIGPLIPF